MVKFTNCRDKVAQTYLVLDLSTILVLGEEEGVEGDEEEVVTIKVDEAAIKAPRPKMTIIRAPKEQATGM